MLTDYKAFNKKFGLRKLQGFVTPKVLDLNAVVIPYYSMVYIFNPNSKHYVSNEHYFLRFTKKKFVYNTIGYNKPIYDVRAKKVNENGILRTISKEQPGIRLYKHDKFMKFLVSKPNDIKHTLPVINMNTVHEGAVYRATILEYYQMFKNGLNTLINNVIDFDNKTKIKGKHDINHFIVMEIPDVLYSLPILEKYSKYETPTTEMVKLFFDTSRLLLLELMKLLDDDLTKTSLFYKLIESGKAKQVTLVYGRIDKGVFINLHDLYSFLKISNYENSSKVDGRQLQKLFFFMIKTILQLPGFTPEDIDDNTYADKIVKTIGKDTISISDDENSMQDKDLLKQLDIDLKEEDVNVINEVEEAVASVEEGEEDVITSSYKTRYAGKEDKSMGGSIEAESFSILENLAENKHLTKQKHRKLVELAKEGMDKPSPFGGKEKIKDLVTITEEELNITDDDKLIPTTNTLFNKDEAMDPLNAIKKKYVKKIYKKDLVSNMMSMNKAGLIVKDIKREVHDDILGPYEEFTMSVNDMGKSNYNIKVRLPKIEEDGTYMISGNQYVLKTLKSPLPIIKLDFNRVSLTSAYGKLFVDRAPMKKFDRGFAIKKQVVAMGVDGKVNNFVSGSIKLMDVQVPSDYSVFSRYIKSFNFDNFNFSFSYFKREELIGNDKLSDIEKDGYVVCGKYKKDVIVMGEDNFIYLYRNKKYDKINTLPDMLELDVKKIRPEFTMVRVGKGYVPTGIMLSYYMGLFGLLKFLKIEYEVLDGGRVRVNEEDVIVLRFKFNTVVVKKSSLTNNLIVEGIAYEDKVSKKVDIDVYNNKELFKTVFNEMGLALTNTTDIELYENMFIDPVTKTTLEGMKEPTTFIELIVRATELLTDDSYSNPNSMKAYVMKGYERIPQYVYKTLVTSLKKKKNEEFFGRSRLMVDPYGTWRTINEDPAAALIEDINPIALLKQHEDSTYLGTGARGKESLNMDARETHVDDIGIISESSKDSTDAGVTKFMSANPVIKNLRGFRGEKEELNPSNILSTSGMLAPFAMNDDPKRLKELK